MWTWCCGGATGHWPGHGDPALPPAGVRQRRCSRQGQSPVALLCAGAPVSAQPRPDLLPVGEEPQEKWPRADFPLGDTDTRGCCCLLGVLKAWPPWDGLGPRTRPRPDCSFTLCRAWGHGVVQPPTQQQVPALLTSTPWPAALFPAG